MKNILILTVIVLLPGIVKAQGGSVGDVKYSILGPAAFTRVNGQTWALMDGRNIEGTKLAELTGRQTLPDARGLFLRSLNAQRTDGNGDPDGERNAGAFQGDDFKSHNHVTNATQASGWRRDGAIAHKSAADGLVNSDANPVTSGTGGNETRPKNIALYVYIKINE